MLSSWPTAEAKTWASRSSVSHPSWSLSTSWQSGVSEGPPSWLLLLPSSRLPASQDLGDFP